MDREHLIVLRSCIAIAAASVLFLAGCASTPSAPDECMNINLNTHNDTSTLPALYDAIKLRALAAQARKAPPDVSIFSGSYKPSRLFVGGMKQHTDGEVDETSILTSVTFAHGDYGNVVSGDREIPVVAALDKAGRTTLYPLSDVRSVERQTLNQWIITLATGRKVTTLSKCDNWFPFRMYSPTWKRWWRMQVTGKGVDKVSYGACLGCDEKAIARPLSPELGEIGVVTMILSAPEAREMARDMLSRSAARQARYRAQYQQCLQQAEATAKSRYDYWKTRVGVLPNGLIQCPNKAACNAITDWRTHSWPTYQCGVAP